LKSVLKYHFIPLIIGLTISSILLIFGTSILKSKSENNTITVKGTKTTVRGYFANLNSNDSSELELVGSLTEKNGISLFGSSELSNETSYIPYYYLPDSLGIRVNGFGHAFHQSFSMYCELLALKDYLKDAKICIIVSPGWFEGEGTNIEAFLEFVKPNFLQRIITDNSISEFEKYQIGKYLFDNSELIKNPDRKIKYFTSLYEYNKLPILSSYLIARNNEFSKIHYKLSRNSKLKKINRKINWSKQFKGLQTEFVKSINSNKQYISDNYFNSFLKTKDGSIPSEEFANISLKNQELKDFKLLINLLIEKKAKPSIIIQNLNPYYYNNLKGFNSTLAIILKLLEKNNIPYLNMFTPNRKNYIPGILDDRMHSGNLGWMKMNKFIVDTYYAEK
jgi:D-alanine transfer protein